MNKKENEKEILLKFQATSGLTMEVLSQSNAQRLFPEYTGENPDFIIAYRGEHIGVELAQLSLTHSPQLRGDGVNLPHLASKQPSHFNNLETLKESLAYGRRLLPHDLVEPVVCEKILDKLKKIPLYVTEKIWVLLFARESHNAKMVQDLIEDNAIRDLRRSVSRLNLPPRIEKIFLFETATGEMDYLVDLLEEAYKQRVIPERLI